MKKKILVSILLICLIIPCCFMFTGCKKDDGILQLNVRYYYNHASKLEYYVFTSKSSGYKYTLNSGYAEEDAKIIHFFYEYTEDNTTINCIYDQDMMQNGSFASSKFNIITLAVSKNFIMDIAGNTYVAENYLISNNIDYIDSGR